MFRKFRWDMKLVDLEILTLAYFYILKLKSASICFNSTEISYDDFSKDFYVQDILQYTENSSHGVSV